MMVEFVRLGRAGDDDGPAGLHAGENAAAPRGKAFLERIAEGVDLAEQAEHLVVGRDIAADDDVVGDAEFGGARVKIFLDLVDAADERSDIDEQRLQPALLSGSRRC